MTASAIIVLLIAQLGALVHEATVRHVRCEHGELVDAPVLATRGLDPLRLVAAGDSVARCEHCTIANGISTDRSVTGPQIEATRHAAATPLFAFVDQLAPTMARYRTAPKTDPPA